jgi:hypothetical protein
MIILTPTEQKDQAVNRFAIHLLAIESGTKWVGFVLEKGHHLFVKRDYFLDLDTLDAKFTQHDIEQSLEYPLVCTYMSMLRNHTGSDSTSQNPFQLSLSKAEAAWQMSSLSSSGSVSRRRLIRGPMAFLEDMKSLCDGWR